MKIVFLDANTLGEDIDYSPFQELGEVVKYPFSSSEEVPQRVQDADVIVVNKHHLRCPKPETGLRHCHRHQQSG